jgi:hypothetical protein
MTEKELRSFDFSFEINDLSLLEDFMKVAHYEFLFQGQDLINKPGKYKITMIISELDHDETKVV